MAIVGVSMPAVMRGDWNFVVVLRVERVENERLTDHLVGSLMPRGLVKNRGFIMCRNIMNWMHTLIDEWMLGCLKVLNLFVDNFMRWFIGGVIHLSVVFSVGMAVWLSCSMAVQFAEVWA